MTEKKELPDLYNRVKFLKKAYQRRLLRIRKINNITEGVAIVSGTIGTTAIMITLASVNPVPLIVSAVFSSLSTIIKAVKSGMKIQDYMDKLHIAYCQTSDLERDILHALSSEMNNSLLIVNFNNRLSLIEDTAPVVSISK